MESDSIDDLDKAILHLLQEDARNNTNAEIGERVDVAASTVGNRIKEMEARDIIQGYNPEIAYQRADLPLHALFLCSAPVDRRSEMADEALDVYGVVDVRETLSGERNVHLETVSQNIGELETATRELTDLGLRIHRSEILRRHRTRPFNKFGSERFD